MKTRELQDEIVRLLEENRRLSLGEREIAAALALRGAARKRAQKAILDLVRAGRVVRTPAGAYHLGKTDDLVAGRLVVTRSGAGILRGEDGTEVRIARGELGAALPGDQVLVRRPAPAASEGRRPAGGTLLRVLDRGRTHVVGTLRAGGRQFTVVPLDPAYQEDFHVVDADPRDVGKRVVVRVAARPAGHGGADAEIVDVIGFPDRTSVETQSVIRHYGLPGEFPAEVIEEAGRAGALADEPGDRTDLRDRLVVTIDPERARDYDDALSLETDGAGRRVLGVHIADVSHFVRPGSLLDGEARRRGNSTYFPDRVIPMLPEQLSNGLCSLKPEADRLAFSVFLTLDDAGVPVARRFARSLIRSARRLTYEEAMAILSDGREAGAAADGGVGDLLTRLSALAQQLRRNRFDHCALDLDVPEASPFLDGDGQVAGIRLESSDPSHQLVEECMVAANEAVATALADAGVPFIARRHDPPRRVRMEELALELSVLGFKPGTLTDRRRLARFLASLKGHPLAQSARVAVLRSMSRAVYDTESEGHFGLAKRFYGHFTSPIRRYPDLVLHRLLARHVAAGGSSAHEARPGDDPAADREGLRAVAFGCTRTEQLSEEAERAAEEILKFRYLERLLREGKAPVYRAVVSRVFRSGLLAEMPDVQLQGMLPVAALRAMHVRYNARTHALSAGKLVLQPGSVLRVRLARLDFDQRRIDLALA